MNGYYAFPFNVATHSHEHMLWENGFTKDQLRQITTYGDALVAADASVSDGVDKEIRTSQVAWIEPNTDTEWMFENIAKIARDINKQRFNFDLTGMFALQYTIYDASKGGPSFYDWHIDHIDGKNEYVIPRKLSLSLQLSDPHDYEGGELWLHGSNRVCIPKQKGLIVAFPSYTSHRVSPVTMGVRKSLVVWVVGPDYR